MLLSVIIPTCHRNDLLARCLDRLAPGAQTLSPEHYEVIVTDDGVRSTAEPVVHQRYPFARWLRGPRRGPAANRNHGARHARGEWVALVDDDCEPDRGWLKAIADALRTQQLEVVEGKTICPGKRDDPFEEHVENLNGGVYWSCNLAVRREAFEELKGFDEDFLEAGGEDMEFAWRIRERRLRTVFVAEAIVAHPPRLITWRKIWWRTFLMRWILLYHLKTGQSVPLTCPRLVAVATLIRERCVELLRTSWRAVREFQSGFWRTRWFYLIWRWVTFPLVLPYLVIWELRFRKQLSG